MYGTLYGMHRTTVYFPDDIRESVVQLASELQCTEAQVVRDAIRSYVDSRKKLRPTLPLFTSNHRTLAERVDEELKGFGER